MMSDVYDWFDRPLEQLKETVSEHKEKLDEGHISEGDEVFEHSRFLADKAEARSCIKQALIDFLAETVGKTEFFRSYIELTGDDLDGDAFIRDLFAPRPNKPLTMT